MLPSRFTRGSGPESQIFAGRCELSLAERAETATEHATILQSPRLREVLDWLNAEFDDWSSAPIRPSPADRE